MLTDFLQTAKPERDVWAKLLSETKMRPTQFWLLLTAVYGLVNSNADCQKKSDQIFKYFGLTQCEQVP